MRDYRAKCVKVGRFAFIEHLLSSKKIHYLSVITKHLISYSFVGSEIAKTIKFYMQFFGNV